MIVLFLKTPSATWRVQVSQAPLTAAAIRAVVAEQHGVPAARQRFFLDAELCRPARAAALAGLAHGATVHFREAEPSGDNDGGATDEEAGSSSDFASSAVERQAPQQPVAQPRTGEPTAGDVATRSPLRVANGVTGDFTGGGSDAEVLEEASPHARLAADGGAVSVTRVPYSPVGYGAVPPAVDVRTAPFEVLVIRRAYSFAWGLRLLCLVDGILLYGSLLLPICPPLLRALTLALLWGPPLSYAAVSTLAPRPLFMAMCYHLVACAVPLAMAWPHATAPHGMGPAGNDAGGTGDDATTASGGGGDSGSACAAGWLLLPPLFHAWALSLLVRFHACLAALAPHEKQLLRRLFLLR